MRASWGCTAGIAYTQRALGPRLCSLNSKNVCSRTSPIAARSSQLAERIPHYALRTTHFAFRISHFAVQTSHFALRTSNVALGTSRFRPCASTSHFAAGLQQVAGEPPKESRARLACGGCRSPGPQSSCINRWSRAPAATVNARVAPPDSAPHPRKGPCWPRPHIAPAQ